MYRPALLTRLLGAAGLCALVALAIAGRPEREPTPRTSPATGTALPAAAAASLAQLRARTLTEFRQRDGVWEGGGSGYAVRIDAAALELRPRGSPASAALRLGAARLERDGWRLELQAASLAPLADGSLARGDGHVRERFENTAQGLEQSWEFAGRPGGSGGLTVRLATAAALRATTDTGLHFAAGSLGVAYGHGTWVDAAGQRTPVPASWDGQAIVLRVPEELLARSAYPAVLDPLVSAELQLDTPINSPVPGSQETPAIAWNGTNYLAAWDTYGAGIYATRISPAGVVLDPAGIYVAAPDYFQVSPAIASDGTDFVVVWANNRDPSNSGGGGQVPDVIEAARVTASGAVLDFGGVVLATLPLTPSVTSGYRPGIAWSGSAFLVTWAENNGAWSVQGLRLTSNPLTPVGAKFTIAAGVDERYAEAAWNGTAWLTVWQQSTNILGAFVTPAGAVQSAFPINAGDGSQQKPSVAWNGTSFLVAWADLMSTDVLGARVSGTGMVQDSSGFAIGTGTGPDDAPRVTAQGSSGFFVAWTSDPGGGTPDIRGAQVSNAAAVTPAGGGAIAAATGSQVQVAVASNGSSVMAVWSDNRLVGTGFEIFGTSISAAGAVQSPSGTRISGVANAQRAPAVAFNGTNFLAVWEDLRGGNSDIYGVRVTPAGVVLDSPALVISGAANDQRAPTVTWTGANFFVAWQDERTAAGSTDIYGARVSPAGLVLDAAGIAIATTAPNQTDPSAASNGSEAYVTWVHEVSGMNTDIYGARVSNAGLVLDPAGVTVTTQVSVQRQPAVAWNGTSYLVVWTDERTTPGIYGRQVSSAGVPQGAFDLPIATFGLGRVRTAPAIGANGSFYFVAWSESAPGSQGTDLYGLRLNGGSILDVQLSLGLPDGGSMVGDQTNPAVAADGTHFYVTWQDERAGQANPDIYGRRVVAATGTVLDGTGFPISSGLLDETVPAIANAGTKSFLVTYQGFHLNSATNALRTLGRLLSNALPVATPASTTTPEDTPVGVTLTGSDGDGDPLTFTVIAQPTHGALSGTAPNLTYTPAANYFGPDSFTFKTNDSFVDSATSTVSLTVTSVNDLPQANAQSASTPEDTPLALVLTGSDVESTSLSYTLVVQPTHGSLSGSGANLTYSPAANYNGPDSFTFKVNDGTADSATTATVSLTIAAVNDTPVATPQSISTNEDTSRSVTLGGTDVEGSALTFNVTAQPTHGTLVGSGASWTYTPAADYFGPDSFQFTASDGTATSTAASVSINVQPVNDPPTATSQALGTPRNTQLVITLSGSDVDNNPLTYVVVTQPTHGTLSGTGATRTYTPATDYAGSDSFTFKVNDGTVDSPEVTVTIAVASTNRAPTATPQTRTTAEDTALTITLAGTDPDGNTLTYAVLTQPQHGTLSGTGATRSYTPAADYHGTDSFTFRVNDGSLDSPSATVDLTITPVNDAPVASNQNVSTLEDTARTITLAGTDVDGDGLIFAVTVQPSHGTLTGTPPTLTYTPALDYNGADAFSFKANDGTVDSASAANVNIVIGAVNDPPVAQAQAVSTPQDTAKAITLGAADPDGDALVYTVLAQPQHGTIMGTAPSLSYVPAAGYRGSDSFTFKANDMQQDSNVATVSISVAAVNHAPVVNAQTLTVAEDGTLPVAITGADSDGDAITFAVVDQPAHGTVTGTGAALSYTPAANYNGADSFTVKANDGVVDSAAARISVTVSPVNDPPTALMQAVTASEDVSVGIVLAGMDVDGDALTYTVVDAPGHGVLSGNPPNLTLTPAANYHGDDRFTFKVNDGTVDSASAAVTVTVRAVNDAPTADPVTLSTGHDTPVAVTLTGTDPDGDPLTFSVETPPANGTLSGTAPDLTFTPTAGFGGTDSFAYRVSDGTESSAAALVTITVAAGPPSDTPNRNYAQVNGWSCGCQGGAAGPEAWALFGLGALWLGRRRRGATAAKGLLGAVLLTAAVGHAKPAAKAAPAAKKPAASAAPAPAASPVPAATAPAPAPAAPSPPVSPKPAPPATAPAATVQASPAASPASPTPQGPPLATLAAMEVTVTVPNEKLDGSAFSEMMVSAVDGSKLFKVISAAEVRTMLGMERQRQLLGCAEESCLAEISDALGAQYALDGTVGKVGENYLVAVRLIDSRHSRIAGRAALQTTEANKLLELIWRATQDTLDAAAATLPPEERQRWLDRPRQQPGTAADRSKFGFAVTGVFGYQPLGDAGSRASLGGQVDFVWRLARFDLNAGLVISPSPGARLTVALAVINARYRLGLGLRASAFPFAGLYGGGPVVLNEFALTPAFGVRALIAGEAYAGAPKFVLAVLAGLGVEAHF